MSPARTAAAAALLAGVVAMAVLPAAIVSGAADSVVRPLAPALGGLALALGGVKVAAASWGLLIRVLERASLGAVAASID